MDIQESVSLLINDFAGPEDFASFVQSWWSGNSNDVIVICRSGRVLCRAEGEVALGATGGRSGPPVFLSVNGHSPLCESTCTGESKPSPVAPGDRQWHPTSTLIRRCSFR